MTSNFGCLYLENRWVSQLAGYIFVNGMHSAIYVWSYVEIRAFMRMCHVNVNVHIPLLKVELWCHQLRCEWFASQFSFSPMLSINLTTCFQYSSKLLFFLNIVTYFVLSKQIWILYDQLFLEFPYEGKSLSASLQHRRPISYLHKEILWRKKI